MNIKNWQSLLQNIAAGLNKFEDVKISYLEVLLYKNKHLVLCTDLQTALDYIANDIYWNENSNWSDANKAVVRVI